jgi:hypothetical protein
MNERVGRLVCGLVFVGFDLTFFPTHILGLPSRPRRIYTYPPDFAVGWSESVREPQLVPAGCRLPAVLHRYHAQHGNRFARGQ